MFTIMCVTGFITIEKGAFTLHSSPGQYRNDFLSDSYRSAFSRITYYGYQMAPKILDELRHDDTT